MTKEDRLQRAEDCLRKAEDAAHDEPKARVYLQTADFWIRLALAE